MTGRVLPGQRGFELALTRSTKAGLLEPDEFAVETGERTFALSELMVREAWRRDQRALPPPRRHRRLPDPEQRMMTGDLHLVVIRWIAPGIKNRANPTTGGWSPNRAASQPSPTTWSNQGKTPEPAPPEGE